ncbi:pseudaminic acid synthase (plasmid) [Brevirhabdus pacifica]|uniref:Pseudaminic acid synthase n=1 Tax=Brevirhabdus pacifica TaxID=1267768 RepID=A0A1P8QYD8_9RHOB|nr:pseudaminic acid synthase [Brevirhabdus pacifica]APX91387.1 pseudaminic acid synthase [Brevirhabdus pacifica]OWU74208.1 N-acetylneuraminate synthase [Loktanella sp. 22II-4b]PJJ78983.1 N-acetylneuraminate synthase [Brevirhabdus pacifica]
MRIASRDIGPEFPPYLIAEMSANHNGDIERAFRIMEVARAAGADALKIQSYTADTITIRSDRPEFQIKGGLWDGRSLHDLYSWAQMPWDWHGPLFDKARDLGITIFSSPFDFTAVDMLEKLDAPAYKIASFEAIDLPLIRHVAQTGKPMIISSGMADATEIAEAVDAARDAGCTELVVLLCVSGYPAPASDYNLRTLTDMQSRFGVLTGLSDHTIDNTAAIAAVGLGACVIEKHVTLDRNGGGPDDSFSLEPDELTALVEASHTAWKALGKVDYGHKSSEVQNVIFRRSLYAVADIPKGALLSHENVRSIRPGWGLAPKHLEAVIGRRAARDIPRATPLAFELIED